MMYGVIGIRLIIGSVRWPSRPRPWVARLGGLDDRFGFARTFIKGVYDYTYATRGTGKNTYLYFALPPGLYEVYWPTSWKHEYRGFRRVDECGNVHDMTEQEVLECLKNAASA
jgi:hypothetical protein